MAELIWQQENDVCVVRFLSSRIMSDVVIAEIGQELLNLVDQAQGRLLLNFENVTFVSSGMIGKLLLLNKKCTASATAVKICCLGPAISEIFAITRLHRMFSIHNTAAEALAAFEQQRIPAEA